MDFKQKYKLLKENADAPVKKYGELVSTPLEKELYANMLKLKEYILNIESQLKAQSPKANKILDFIVAMDEKNLLSLSVDIETAKILEQYGVRELALDIYEALLGEDSENQEIIKAIQRLNAKK